MFNFLAPNGVKRSRRKFKQGQHNKGHCQSYPPFSVLSITLCNGYTTH